MTPAERERAFQRERRRQIKRYVNADRKTAAEVEKILENGEKRIRAEIGEANLSEFQSWQLPNLQQSIDTAMADVAAILSEKATAAVNETFAIGVDLIEKPIASGGIAIQAMMPDVDLRKLMAIRAFTIDRMKDVSTEAAQKIKSQIGLIMIGAQSPGAAVDTVSTIIKGGRTRARTTVRHQMGMAFSIATQERQTQAQKYLPGLKKQWRRSGKLHSRIAHDLADGQIVDVDEPFIVNGLELMFPRDPKAPLEEVLNCGCVQIPYMESWDVRQPGRQPFSDEEVFRNPLKRDIARELNPAIDPSRPGLSSIRSLETLSPSAAKRQIAEDMNTEEFASFLRSRGTRDHRAIGVMPDNLASPLGSEARVVRLSSYTAIKQSERRRGQAFDGSDYKKLQSMMDRGAAFKDGDNHLVLFRNIDGDEWKAVLKRTKDGREVYLESLHRSHARQQRRAGKILKPIRGEE